MQVNQKTNLTLVCILAASVLSLTGCQSIGFKQPSFALPSIPMPNLPKPDLGKLAFWKKGDGDLKIPPPPARIFDPAPINGDSRVAGVNRAGERGRFDNRGDVVLNEIDSAFNATEKPSRKPYSNDIAEDSSRPEPNQFEFNTGNVRSKLEMLEHDTAQGLTDEQQDFQSAMRGANNQFEAKVGEIATQANEFGKDLSGSFDTGFASPPKSQNDFSANTMAGLPPMAKPAPLAISPGAMRPGQNALAPLPFTQPPAADFNSDLAQDGFKDDAPENILRRSNPPIPAPRSYPNAPQIQPNPYFPATPHAGFGSGEVATGPIPNFAPGDPISASQSGHQSPNGSGDGSGASANRIPTYVSDVNIPDSILQGSGSYAPGSVNRLKSTPRPGF